MNERADILADKAPAENSGVVSPQTYRPVLDFVNDKPQGTGEDFKARAKAFEPAAGAMWNIPIGISVKILRNRVIRITEDEEQADQISELARPSPESAKAAKEATARLMARHNVSDDTADWTIVAGCAADIGHGFWDCLQAIKQIEIKQLARQKAKDKSDK